jgi:hypothetical protein
VFVFCSVIKLSRGAIRARYRYRIQRIQQEILTGEKGERDLESHRKYKTYLLSFALVTCEDDVRTTRNSYNQQPTEKAGHTDIRTYGQNLLVCRTYDQDHFCP